MLLRGRDGDKRKEWRMKKKKKEKKRKVVGYSTFNEKGRAYHKLVKVGAYREFVCMQEHAYDKEYGDKFVKKLPKGKKMCVRCEKIK